MIDYGYKALMQNPDCGAKRFVAFHDADLLSWEEASDKAHRNMTSQTCIRCGANHKNSEFCMTDLEIHQ